MFHNYYKHKVRDLKTIVYSKKKKKKFDIIVNVCKIIQTFKSIVMILRTIPKRKLKRILIKMNINDDELILKLPGG